VIMFFSQMQSVCCKKKVVLGCWVISILFIVGSNNCRAMSLSNCIDKIESPICKIMYQSMYFSF
jgi:hypothetical protein